VEAVPVKVIDLAATSENFYKWLSAHGFALVIRPAEAHGVVTVGLEDGVKVTPPGCLGRLPEREAGCPSDCLTSAQSLAAKLQGMQLHRGSLDKYGLGVEKITCPAYFRPPEIDPRSAAATAL
jgi:hypothetical protein